MSTATKAIKRSALLAVLAFAAIVLPAAGQASASTLLRLDTLANTQIAPGANQEYYVQVTNLGETASSAPWQLHVTLPPELTATSLAGGGLEDCTPAIAADPHSFSCTSAATIPGTHDNKANDFILHLTVSAGSEAAGLAVARFSVFGGGATLPDGGACDAAYPGVPCAATADPSELTSMPPAFGIDAFDGGAFADEGGTPYLQAGGHPYAASTHFDFNVGPGIHPKVVPVGNPVGAVKDASVELPAGLIGVLRDLPQCEPSALASDRSHNQNPYCDPAAQIGTAIVRLSGLGFGANLIGPRPLYNLNPPANAPARFGFNVIGVVVTLTPRVGSYPHYPVVIDGLNVSEGIAVNGVSVDIWGTPADPVHDLRRACPAGEAPQYIIPGPNVTDCPDAYARPPETAFLRMPTSCHGPLGFVMHADSWQNPAARTADGFPDLSDPGWESASFLTHQPLGFPFPVDEWGAAAAISGCDQVPFEPTIALAPTTPAADSPSGLVVDISVPQEGLPDPVAIGQSDLKDAIVKLPQGFTINPASAAGLGSCAPAQVQLESTNAAHCPDSSKIGTVEIETPALTEPLEGSVFLASQGDNPFGSLLALYLVAEGGGVTLKLPGKVEADPSTGQLTTVFTEQPQFPFSSLHLRLKGGTRAPLRTPSSCGTHATEATFVPWSGNAPAHLQSPFQISAGPQNGPCPSSSFDPKLEAGTPNPLAGAFAPFNLRLQRADGTQELGSLAATLPEGLLGSLRGIPYCSDAALATVSKALGSGAGQEASPACPAASRVGTVTVGAGAGSTPFYTSSGRAYLAGPYKGAPLSLAVIAPAVAGPFDLGSVVVRNALRIDPVSTELTVVSDPLPSILHGIQLDLRDIRVQIDRPRFTLNPTSCDPMAIDATLASTQGATAQRSDRFQVGNCDRLAFKPKLSLRLKGGTRRSKHPALRATLTMPKARGANIARASVALPHALFLAQSHIRTICTRVQFAAEQCPKGSVYGHARAFSPLLDEPLEGPVYLRSSNHPLPDLVASLKGQIDVELAGRIDQVNGGIRTTFATVPDAPVSKFVLAMQGGRKGLLENSLNLCRSRHRATALFDAQNGKVRDLHPLLRVRCGAKKKQR